MPPLKVFRALPGVDIRAQHLPSWHLAEQHSSAFEHAEPFATHSRPPGVVPGSPIAGGTVPTRTFGVVVSTDGDAVGDNEGFNEGAELGGKDGRLVGG